jgi:hypothetical protein
MKNRSQFKISTICLTLVLLLATGCSATKSGSQTPTGMGDSDKSDSVPSSDLNQSSNNEIIVEGVTISDTNIAFHGKSSLPAETCINTKLLADGTPLPWWPDDACADRGKGTWEFKVPLSDNKLQTQAQYVLNVYQRDDQNVTTTFAFDLSRPPMPSE